MGELLLATVAFVLSHLIPAMPSFRAFLIRALGRPLYLILYSVMSLAVIVWLGFAYVDAPLVTVWEPVAWMRWVPALIMPVSCVLLVAALSSVVASSTQQNWPGSYLVISGMWNLVSSCRLSMSGTRRLGGAGPPGAL